MFRNGRELLNTEEATHVKYLYTRALSTAYSLVSVLSKQKEKMLLHAKSHDSEILDITVTLLL